MSFLDEKIALLEKNSRMLEKQEKTKDLKKEKTIQKLTLEEAREGIQKGALLFYNEKLEFETRKYFKERFPCIIIKDFFDEVEEKEERILFVSNPKEVVLLCTCLDCAIELESLEKRRIALERDMLQMGIYAETLKEQELDKLSYLCYHSPTGKGMVYNFVFWIQAKERTIVGNFNCLEEQKDSYGILLEAMLWEINEQLKTDIHNP